MNAFAVRLRSKIFNVRRSTGPPRNIATRKMMDVRGFASNDLREAFDEADRIAEGTKAKQHLFSLSLNPPQDRDVGIEAFEDGEARRKGCRS